MILKRVIWQEKFVIHLTRNTVISATKSTGASIKVFASNYVRIGNMKVLSEKQRENMLKKCNAGKHKLRTNRFGVTWCVYCGVLSNADAEPLTEEDKVMYVKNN